MFRLTKSIYLVYLPHLIFFFNFEILFILNFLFFFYFYREHVIRLILRKNLVNGFAASKHFEEFLINGIMFSPYLRK